MEDFSDPHSPGLLPVFEARLRPHRSLNARQFRILMWCVAGGGAFVTLPFWMLGAWPIIGFLGLDVLLVYLAFRANFIAARSYEDVRMTPLALDFVKVSAKGQRRAWHFNPAWVRLTRVEHEDYGIMRLAFASRGREVQVAGDLGPAQRADFARDFSRALHEARRGIRYN